jgi:uroporphyrinogen-III synthase
MQGRRIGVTSGRKGAELADALRRRGALPLWGPTVGGDQPEPESRLLEQTDAVLDAGVTWLAASTGVGMRLWADTARRHGRLEALRETAARARRVARGAKAVGGLQGTLGLAPEWVGPDETDAAVAGHLVANVTAEDVVAVQLHGGPSRAYDAVAATGARVLTVLPYRSVLPEDTAPARRLVEAALAGELDLLVFTSPGAVHNLVTIAAEVAPDAPDRLRALTGAAQGLAVASVGPVTDGACRQVGFEVAVSPTRSRTGDLLRAIERWAEQPPASEGTQPRR